MNLLNLTTYDNKTRQVVKLDYLFANPNDSNAKNFSQTPESLSRWEIDFQKQPFSKPMFPRNFAVQLHTYNLVGSWEVRPI